MIRLLLVAIVLSVSLPVAAQDATVRAEALVGLARVARDTGQLTEADTHFRAADRLRPFDATLRREHFWVVAKVDAVRAMTMARQLADAGAADAPVLEQWLALAVARDDQAHVVEASRHGLRASPDRADWLRSLGGGLLRLDRPREAAAAFGDAAAKPGGTIDDRAMQALALERTGDREAAQRAWQAVPDAARRARADWWASDLRTSASADRPAQQADAFASFVAAHPGDSGMRAMAVESLAAARKPTRALALIGPLLAGPDSLRWRRREGEIALAANDAPRARAAFAAIEASGRATADDHWRLLEVTAAQAPAAQTLTRLEQLGIDAPCGTRALGVADLADADEVFAWVAGARPADCPVPERLALRAARWMAAHDDDLAATQLLQRAFDAPGASDSVAMALAERLVARGDARDADALLTMRILAAPGSVPFDLVAARAWARAADGRPIDAWQSVTPMLDAQRLSAEEGVAWAGLALAAGDLTAAARLAKPGVGSTRDLASRQVLASVAQREGRQHDAFEWLSPVAGQIASPHEARSWLDAVASIGGPADALREAAALPDAALADVDLAARLSIWATALGRDAEADRHAAFVAAGDPARAELLALERKVAAGQPLAAVSGLAARDLSVEPEAVLRVLITAALDARAWDVADAALDAWRTRPLDEDWGLVKASALALGRDGQVDTALLARLDARAASGTAADELVATLARAKASRGEPDAALARLGWPTIDATAPLVVREAALDILAEAGRHGDVLTLLAEAPVASVRGDVVRARALLALDRRAEALTLLEGLAVPARSPEAWRLLADVQDTPAGRISVLSSAVERIPDTPSLWTALAQARLAAGQPADARRAALHATALDARDVEAWRVRLAVPPMADADRRAELDEAGRLFDGAASVRLALAEAALTTQLTDGQAAAVVASWLTHPAVAADGRSLRLQARLALATGQWDTAIAAVAAARALEPDNLGLRRLEAQVHAWSGRHAAGASHYAAYLQMAPRDAEAWREYARLLSWMQDPGRSQAAYARAAALVPAPSLDAERRTKAALARQAWRLAATESATWLSLEPDSLDARVDRAVALDRSGRVNEAARLYTGLASETALPANLRLAASRYGHAHRPGATLQAFVDSADGFGTQRLIEQRLLQAGVSNRLGVGGQTVVFADAGRGTLDSGATLWNLTQLRAGADVRLAPGWQATGEAGWADLGGQVAGVATLRAGLAATPTDGLLLRAGAERRPFWENGATVETGLMASGGSAGLEWLPAANWRVQANATGHRLSDGNLRHEASASLAWRASRGPRELELRTSSFLFGYRDVSPAYFSPANFVRTDLEAELRHVFGQPRLDGGLRPSIAAGLGVGVDSREARYGLGLARVTLPLGGPWALVGEGRWVQASVFRASRVGVWIQLGSPR